MTLIILTMLVCHPWEWLTWTLPLCRMFLASRHLTPRVRSPGCWRDSFGMSSVYWYRTRGLPRRLSMTLSSRISVPSQSGGWAGSFPVTSHITGDAGRRFCFVRQEEMEQLRRSCRDWLERAFRQGHPGYCPTCKEYVVIALDRNMMNTHLELGQLWRAVSGRVVRYVEGFGMRLSGSFAGETWGVAVRLGKFFPPWTVPPWLLACGPSAGHIWRGCGCQALSWFGTPTGAQVSDLPWSHPSSGGEGGGCQKDVCRTIVIAQLAHLHLTSLLIWEIWLINLHNNKS